MEDKSGCRIQVRGPSIKSRYGANNESDEKQDYVQINGWSQTDVTKASIMITEILEKSQEPRDANQ